MREKVWADESGRRAARGPRALGALGGNGLPIRVVPNGAYEDETVALAEGDVVVVHSDGIVEARRERDPFSTQRLGDALCSVAGASAHAVVETILRNVEAHAPERCDDRRFVVLKRHARNVR